LCRGGGYWVSVSYAGTTRILRFDEALPNGDITVSDEIQVASADFSHLVPYGPNCMIVAWETGSGMTAEVRDRNSGNVVGSQFSVDVPDHRYQDFREFPDYSVAYPAQGSGGNTVRIARVLPCGG
jgi:hypothetical protein